MQEKSAIRIEPYYQLDLSTGCLIRYLAILVIGLLAGPLLAADLALPMARSALAAATAL